MRRQKEGYDRNTPFQTIPNAVRTTGLSSYFLRSGCRNGTVPHIRCGNTYMIDVPHLLERLHEQANQSPAERSA